MERTALPLLRTGCSVKAEYANNPIEPNILLLDAILVLFIVYIGGLFCLVKEKEIMKSLLGYFILLEILSFILGMNYITLRGIFPFDIILYIGEIIVSVVRNPVYYYNLHNPVFENIIQNSLLYIVIMLFYYKYIKVSEKKPIRICHLITFLVFIINSQIGYGLYYIKYNYEMYQHGLITGITFFLSLYGIYCERDNKKVLSYLYKVGILLIILNMVYFVTNYIKNIVEWKYFASILYFISDIAITPFSIEGSISYSSKNSCLYAILLIVILTVISWIFYRRNVRKNVSMELNTGSLEN